MLTARSRGLIALLGLALAAPLASCGKGAGGQTAAGGPTRRLAPVAAQGAVSVTTRNTTRLGGENVAADAAAVARAVYPGLTTETRPQAVVLVDEHNWPAALAASALAGAPLGAPILYSEGASLPEVSRQSAGSDAPDRRLRAGRRAGDQHRHLRPGAGRPGGPHGRRRRTRGDRRLDRAAADRSRRRRRRDAQRDRAARQRAPRAADAGRGPGRRERRADPVRDARPRSRGHRGRARVPAPAVDLRDRRLRRGRSRARRAAALRPRHRDHHGRRGLRRRSPTRSRSRASPTARSAGASKNPATASCSPTPRARSTRRRRRRCRPAATTGRCCCSTRPSGVPAALGAYLGDIQPAYTSAPQFLPVRGVYNHGWLIGDETAISSVTQAELDSLLEISPRRQSPEEASVTQAE